MGKGIEHYVAQSYLRKFTYDGEHLYAFDKTTGRVFSANVRDVAAENDFFGEEIDDFFGLIDNEQPFWLDLLVQNIEEGKQ